LCFRWLERTYPTFSGQRTPLRVRFESEADDPAIVRKAPGVPAPYVVRKGK